MLKEDEENGNHRELKGKYGHLMRQDLFINNTMEAKIKGKILMRSAIIFVEQIKVKICRVVSKNEGMYMAMYKVVEGVMYKAKKISNYSTDNCSFLTKKGKGEWRYLVIIPRPYQSQFLRSRASEGARDANRRGALSMHS